MPSFIAFITRVALITFNYKEKIITFPDWQLKNEKDFWIEIFTNTSTHNYDVCITQNVYVKKALGSIFTGQNFKKSDWLFWGLVNPEQIKNPGSGVFEDFS